MPFGTSRFLDENANLFLKNITIITVFFSNRSLLRPDTLTMENNLI